MDFNEEREKLLKALKELQNKVDNNYTGSRVGDVLKQRSNRGFLNRVASRFRREK